MPPVITARTPFRFSCYSQHTGTPDMPEIASTSIRHHLDRRAGAIAEAGAGNPDDLLSTEAVADWLGCSTQFLEVGRSKGFGPPYVKLSTRRVRYLRSTVLTWLASREHAAGSEYGAGASGRKPGSRVVDGRVVLPAAGV